jgi:hypothetical protein
MKKILATAVVWTLPLLALAQTNDTVDTGNINAAIQNLIKTVNLLVPLMLGVAVIVFIYGVIKYILAEKDLDRKKAVDRIVWSVVGIASILAVWGLARLLISIFGLKPTDLTPDLVPSVPGSNNTP